MTKKKMGGLGKLSQFSGIRRQEEEIKSQESEVRSQNQETHPPPIQNPCLDFARQSSKIQNPEKLVTVNIKVPKSQRDWLTERASQVRDNNIQPVPSKERVYPQHLIGMAIDLLQAAEVDWAQIKNLEDLREQLNL